MNKEGLDKALQELIAKKDELSKLTYDDARYDDIEEELHDMEDNFNEEYGEYLEEVLEEVHSKIAPESDVLLPTAYLPGSLDVVMPVGTKAKMGSSNSSGVLIDAEEYPDKDARLLLIANPPRLILTVGKKQQEVWKMA
ncbi:MAG: hypothetical protein EOO03_09985 [Chitinophagaceae bacterium]|nr:MAG: hypothetical protein EOO03_09985 [Chitinophagaceae bacterium]